MKICLFINLGVLFFVAGVGLSLDSIFTTMFHSTENDLYYQLARFCRLPGRGAITGESFKRFTNNTPHQLCLLLSLSTQPKFIPHLSAQLALVFARSVHVLAALSRPKLTG